METYELPELFQLVASYDKSFESLAYPKTEQQQGKADLSAESWAAALGDIPADFAKSVVVEHYRRNSTSVTTSVIHREWVEYRNQQIQKAESAEIKAKRRPSAEESLRGWERATAALLEARGQDADEAIEDIRARRTVLQVKCPVCKALPGKGCVVNTGKRIQPLSNNNSHPSRFDAAGIEQQRPTMPPRTREYREEIPGAAPMPEE
ncbi:MULTISPECIES: zinc finger domain-containing protein [Actinopolyspora]|uniref:DNA-binding phage zinc finger domain-containing protein n=1 Tax=Actinopolyspora saharensis TaxID=995062 RepID=A0A1H1G919_9ACTN|nr:MULTISPECIES: hypothetical protein [Actinopolyspora]NHD16437.1 hypothetical protein [Actinopolyspora sp. BKK2]NHE75700.1 hypothetical protein [Actinopolyspora sp. BKK1]SDR09742.1 hypothetical protein SAMN04489718_3503 [Actinopolyspora saharensis]